MKSEWTKIWIAVAIVLLAAPIAFAQTTGRIEGRVVNEEGSALPGVTLTLTSPSLQGDRVQVTEADGRYRFLALPPGEYVLKAQLEGFGSLEQTDILVQLDRVVTLEMQMSSAFEEEVTVTSAAPVVDITSTTSGAVFNQEIFQNLPTTRNFQGLAFVAPGVVEGGLGDNPSIGGASAAENRYVVDGLDTTDPAFGTSNFDLPFEFISQVEVKTGGYEAEYGGALGGFLNVITKSGGNDFTGDAFAYYNDDSLQATEPPTPRTGQDLGFTEYDFGVDVGGKIIQDKLWYFAAVNPSSFERDLTNLQGLALNPQTDAITWAGKLTWQINPSNQFVASLTGFDSETDNAVAARAAAGRLLHNNTSGAANSALTYNGSLTSNLFLELSAGIYNQQLGIQPVTNAPRYDVRQSGAVHFALEQNCGSADPFLGDFTRFSFADGCVGGTFVQESGDSGRDEFRGSATWFAQTGNVEHEIKLGGLWRQVDYLDNAHYPGPAEGAFFDSNGGSVDGAGIPVDAGGLRGQRWQLFNSFALLIEYDQNSFGETDEQAVYFQDQIRLSDYVSLNLGVRADSFEATGEGSALANNRSLDFSFSDMIAPRIGVIYDVARNGRSKLYAHFGRFYESVPLDINARAFGNENFNFYYFYYPEDGSLPNAANPGTHFYTYLLGTGVGVSSDIEPMYTDEYQIGFEYEVLPNLSVGIKGISRELSNVIEDISVDGGQTYFITNPGGTFTSNPVTGEPLDTPAVFPEAQREYDAVELTLNKRFSNNWQLFASYVNSKNEGNYGGLFRQDNGQLDPNITSIFDLPELLNGAFGLLPNDRENQFKVYGSYLWNFGLTTGFFAEVLDGTPISKLGGHPIYGAQERFVTPRGSEGRTPTTWHLDLNFQYPIKFANGMNLNLIADIFNITNEDKPSVVDQEWTFRRATSTTDPNECGGADPACPDGNANFGKALAFQDPRRLRLGVRLSW